MNWLKRILQGHWLGHPLHPAVVHIPTALWPAALLFDALSRAGVGGNAMVLTSFACIAGGLLVAVLAIATGLAEFADIKPGKPARRVAVYHMVLNFAATTLFAINLLIRWDTFRDATKVSVPQLLLSTIGVLILFVSGYLGGVLAYGHGSGVARMSKDKWRRLAEAGHANLPPAKEG